MNRSSLIMAGLGSISGILSTVAFLGPMFLMIPVVGNVLPGVIYGWCTSLALTAGTTDRSRRVLGMLAVGGLGFFAALWAFILLLQTQGMAAAPTGRVTTDKDLVFRMIASSLAGLVGSLIFAIGLAAVLGLNRRPRLLSCFVAVGTLTGGLFFFSPDVPLPLCFVGWQACTAATLGPARARREMMASTNGEMEAGSC